MIATLALAMVLAATPGPATTPASGGAAESTATAPAFGATLGTRTPDRLRPSESVAAPLDTLARVPGSALRLGWSHECTAALGSFRESSSAGAVSVRRGDVRWFGTTAQATLTYRSERLALVRLECSKATPALASYVPDELRRQGYRRVSDEIQSGTETSEWVGAARITLAASGSSLVAEISSRHAEPIAASPPDTAADSAQSGRATGAAAPPVAATLTSPGATPATTAAAGTSAPPTGRASAVASEIDFTNPGRADSLPAPRVASTPSPPVRPQIAVDAGVYGRVLVRAHVDTAGRVVHAEISRGIAEFNSAALAWASDVRFDPYVVQGAPAPVVVTIPVVFARVDSATTGSSR